MFTFPDSKTLSLQLTSDLPVTCYPVVLWPELWLQCQSVDCVRGCSGIQSDTTNKFNVSVAMAMMH